MSLAMSPKSCKFIVQISSKYLQLYDNLDVHVTIFQLVSENHLISILVTQKRGNIDFVQTLP